MVSSDKPGDSFSYHEHVADFQSVEGAYAARELLLAHWNAEYKSGIRIPMRFGGWGPLYRVEPGQVEPLPAFIVLDFTGQVRGWADARLDKDGWVYLAKWPITPYVSGGVLWELLGNPEVKGLLDTVYAGCLPGKNPEDGTQQLTIDGADAKGRLGEIFKAIPPSFVPGSLADWMAAEVLRERLREAALHGEEAMAVVRQIEDEAMLTYAAGAVLLTDAEEVVKRTLDELAATHEGPSM
jgi:hypothetical protein